MRKKIEALDEDVIRRALNGNRKARDSILEHYRNLICFMLNKGIEAASLKTGFDRELFQFDDLLHDNFVILESAILNFKD